jgi:hypothetical protein
VAYEISDVAGFDAAVAALATQGLAPCVKPPVGVFGAGFWRLDERRGLFEQLMDPDARRIGASVFRQALAEAPPGGARLLVLQHLPGDEWSVDCLCDAGRLIAAVARRKSRAHQQLETAGPAIDLARATIATFRLSGLVNVQSKAGTAGGDDPHLLEVNPRMSGGCLYTAFSDVNLPWWQVALALGLADERDIPAPSSPTVAPIGDAAVVGAGSGPTFSDLVRTRPHA